MCHTSIFIFSQNTLLADLIRQIDQLPNVKERILCLSTHGLFIQEKKILQERFGRRCEFKTFADCINRDGMESLDAEADRLVMEKHGSRHGKLLQYQEQLMILKNRWVLESIKDQWMGGRKVVLNDDLGICASVWLNAGFSRGFSLPESPARKSRSIVLLRRIRGVVNRFMVRIPFSQVYRDERRYIFLGRTDRIEQYLDAEVEFMSPCRMEVYAWVLILRLAMFLDGSFGIVSKMAAVFSRFLFRVFVRDKKMLELVAPIHEKRDAFGALSRELGIPLNYLQDGFLPGNFSSCYLKYIYNPRCFLIWDKMSSGYFLKHGLPWRYSSMFADTRLPRVIRSLEPIREILYLASGSGDWTVMKNRSDEDRVFETFVEVARKLPEVHVVFRPHPLWVDPSLQGENSLVRIADYVHRINLSNFHMSTNALEEGAAFMGDKKVSRKSKSIQSEIDNAEIVFGDHSQAIITASRRGRLIASVNVSNRESLFASFLQYGFPLLRTADEIVQFILSFETSSESVDAYNTAIMQYNQNGVRPIS